MARRGRASKGKIQRFGPHKMGGKHPVTRMNEGRMRGRKGKRR